MNAFALSPGGTAALPRVPAPPSNGRHEPSTRSRWMPARDDTRINRRGLALQLGMIALLLLTLIGGFVVFSNRADHPAVLHQATPISTPTADWTNTRGDAGRTGPGASGPVGQPVTIWRFQARWPLRHRPGGRRRHRLRRLRQRRSLRHRPRHRRRAMAVRCAIAYRWRPHRGRRHRDPDRCRWPALWGRCGNRSAGLGRRRPLHRRAGRSGRHARCRRRRWRSGRDSM